MTERMYELSIAAKCGDIKKVDQLLALPWPDILRDNYIKRALHLAIGNGHFEVVEALIDRGGINNISAEIFSDKELSCLDLRTIRKYINCVKRAVDEQSELINAKDNSGRLPLQLAIEEYGRQDIVELLKPISEASDMFLYAIKSSNDHVASQILARNPAFMDLADSRSGKSALHLVAEHGCEMVAAQLFAMRPHLAEVGGICQMNLLQFAAVYGYDTVVGELLVEKPQLIDVTDENLKSVLHLAAEHGREKVVAQLLAAKPALSTQIDKQTMTALHLAAANGHDKVVALLLAHRPGLVDAETARGSTALDLAVRECHKLSALETVACLLAHKPSKVSEDLLWTVLNDANNPSADEIVKLLLSHKPELVQSIAAFGGETVLHRVFRNRPTLTYCIPTPCDSFSEELMSLVWRMNPNGLHTRDQYDKSPFDCAVERGNEFAIQLTQSKLSIDEILGAFAKCRKEYPRTLFDKVRESLLECLHKDVAGTVCEYLGDVNDKKRPVPDDDNDNNKKMRENDNEHSTQSLEQWDFSFGV